MNVAIDKEKFSALGLVYYELGSVGVFDFGTDGLAKANISGTDIVLIPERSSMHKRVVGALGA